MKRLFVLVLLGVMACVGLHRKVDAGEFRIVGSSIQPVYDNPVRRLIYRRPVLLTFDDGPSDASADRTILAVLRKHHARALWLVNCRNFDTDASMLREIAAEGNEIGNHTYSHLLMATLSAKSLRHEIAGCSQAIAAAVGAKPRYFRPPWGLSTPAADALVRADGMQSVLWTSNSFDSLHESFKIHPQEYLEMLRTEPILDPGASAGAGDVVLLHDYPNTARALDGILTRLEARGFQFVVPSNGTSKAG
jgi:peptidoglycan/xylan/chitin deacetylase (PgdA/CDA1 family)